MTEQFLYHGTRTSNVESIMEHGLIPSISQHNYISLTNCEFTAENYANMHDCADSEWTVLKIDMKALDPAFLSPDDQDLPDLMSQNFDKRLKKFSDWSEVPWELSLEIASQVTYSETIDPKHISVYAADEAKPTKSKKLSP